MSSCRIRDFPEGDSGLGGLEQVPVGGVRQEGWMIGDGGTDCIESIPT